MTSIRSSSGPGIVSATFAVAMKTTSREVELDVEVVVAERVVLRRVEHLEQRGRRVAAPVGADLVDLVEHDHRVHRPGVAQRADEPAGQRADVRAPVAADLGLVADAAERHAHELAVRARARSTRRSTSCRCRAARSASGSRPSACRSAMPRSWRSLRTARYSTMRSFTSSRPAWSASSTSRACAGRAAPRSASHHGTAISQSRYVRIIDASPEASPIRSSRVELALGLLAHVLGHAGLRRSSCGTRRRRSRRPRRAPCGSTPSACAGSTRAAASARPTRRRRGCAGAPAARRAARAGVARRARAARRRRRVSSSSTRCSKVEVGRVAAHVSASAPGSVIERRNSAMRSSAPRSSRISSTTARYSRSSSRVCTGGGVSSGRSSTSTRSRPPASVSAAPSDAAMQAGQRDGAAAAGQADALDRPRRRCRRSRTRPRAAARAARAPRRPTSTVRVTVMFGKTTVSSSGISRSFGNATHFLSTNEMSCNCKKYSCSMPVRQIAGTGAGDGRKRL